MDQACVSQAAAQVLFKRADGDQVLGRSGITRARGDKTWQHRRHEIRKANRLLFADRATDLQAHKSGEVGLDWQPWPESDKPRVTRKTIIARDQEQWCSRRHRQRTQHGELLGGDVQLEEALYEPNDVAGGRFPRRQRTVRNDNAIRRGVLSGKLPLHGSHFVVDAFERRVRIVLGNAVWHIDERGSEFQRHRGYLARAEDDQPATPFLSENRSAVTTLRDPDAKRAERTVNHAALTRHHEARFHSPHAVHEGHGLVASNRDRTDGSPRRSANLNRNINSRAVFGVRLKVERRLRSVLDSPRVDADLKTAKRAKTGRVGLEHGLDNT